MDEVSDLGRLDEHEEELSCHPPHSSDLERVRFLQKETLIPEKAQRMAEFFGLLADANRLRILSVLALQADGATK